MRKGRYGFTVLAACMGLLVFVVGMAMVQTQASAGKVKVKHEDLNAKLDQILQQLSDLGGVTFPGDGVQGAPLRYQDNGDGTISDLNTGLMWEKKVSGSNCPHCVNDLYMFSDAAGTWINAVNAEGGKGFAGHSDWRLPNVRELQSIVDYGRFTPATNPVFNNGINSFTVTEFYWSSTPAAINSSFAWQVNFLNGLIDAFDKNGTNNVRAVRGGR